MFAVFTKGMAPSQIECRFGGGVLFFDFFMLIFFLSSGYFNNCIRNTIYQEYKEFADSCVVSSIPI